MRSVLSSTRTVHRLAVLACSLSLGSSFAQDRVVQERRREQWQKVPEIFAEMRIRPGATVADVGASDGFFTSRLARAVGPDGRVFAVDIDDNALQRLRTRLDEEGLRNVTIIRGDVDDPKLPVGVLDSALIINSYHEMEQHRSMLSALRRALKPEGRLVIVEPISDSRRDRPRADQIRDREIEPELVLREARAAGFNIVGLQDPFTIREREVGWLLALKPADPVPSTISSTESKAEAFSATEQADPQLRISLEEFKKLISAGAVTVVDVRDGNSFAAGHIPGALSIPLESIDASAEQLRKFGKPIVTYCS